MKILKLLNDYQKQISCNEVKSIKQFVQSTMTILRENLSPEQINALEQQCQLQQVQETSDLYNFEYQKYPEKERKELEKELKKLFNITFIYDVQNPILALNKYWQTLKLDLSKNYKAQMSCQVMVFETAQRFFQDKLKVTIKQLEEENKEDDEDISDFKFAVTREKAEFYKVPMHELEILVDLQLHTLNIQPEITKHRVIKQLLDSQTNNQEYVFQLPFSTALKQILCAKLNLEPKLIQDPFIFSVCFTEQLELLERQMQKVLAYAAKWKTTLGLKQVRLNNIVTDIDEGISDMSRKTLRPTLKHFMKAFRTNFKASYNDQYMEDSQPNLYTVNIQAQLQKEGVITEFPLAFLAGYVQWWALEMLF
ncbi:Hypothetical_protein [Hexamita inflata]|uniref:Hypothetical_protein n=1 Tax=Hexamita inflata TaxID=28002 RepID=A0AA86PMS0_9EUKA|nr:Hypothetical protein HINF_LOCUS28722 [Hexamita inflata]